MQNSSDKSSALSVVDEPVTVELLTQLRAEMFAPPRVHAYELAQELGCHESGISRFLSGRALLSGRTPTLPHGMGVRAFRTALERLKEQKRKQAA